MAYSDYFAIKAVHQQVLWKVSDLYLLYIEFHSQKHSKVTEKWARNYTHCFLTVEIFLQYILL